ncbi:unnamed protein product [Vitrella brassicaformis CCMP3155]|uniref:PSII 6.1 kDa protein n=1 Tax=Vitrella brassicaformis (strain CCMP3155) TaxID=1169540 RepID=A0A0G4EIQ6_VITBC|nr:unnamed protein product [Vitrella brassicaformis CCMP3155]|mmetsp:Transcript_6220/g.14989  ORF Transcript_6220/g.14989 Transcript_6220/m.14989 type:complete len:136 (-) Transcript_6220:352-759(-)|eukprot:CEL95900.1 unnamed protein product [Vitrella brassicaformis CCMP3155]
MKCLAVGLIALLAVSQCAAIQRDAALSSAFVPPTSRVGLSRSNLLKQRTDRQLSGLDVAPAAAGLAGLMPLLAPALANAEVLDSLSTFELANQTVIWQLLWTFIIVTMGPLIIGYLWFNSTDAGAEVEGLQNVES